MASNKQHRAVVVVVVELREIQTDQKYVEHMYLLLFDEGIFFVKNKIK